MRNRILILIAIAQSILFLGHWFLFETSRFFFFPLSSPWLSPLAATLAVLSLTFVGASLLAMRTAAVPARIFYTVAAVWAGLLNFLVLAGILCWAALGFSRALGLPFPARATAAFLFSLAVVVAAYGINNAATPRVKRIAIRMEDLPESWRGRQVVLVSDLHLGHVRGEGFARRVAAQIALQKPAAVLVAGDLYDGTTADLDRLAAPLGRIPAPLGCYFIAGNHEEFRDHQPYLDALVRAGIHVLDNEKVVINGLEIVGVHYRDTTHPDRYRATLRGAAPSPQLASLLLTHAPNHLSIPAEEGFSLVLCGHTHGGQLFPFRWLPRRVYGRYVYGLNPFGKMQIYTSSGAGTWGPPLRVGTTPEIVVIRLEKAVGPASESQ